MNKTRANRAHYGRLRDRGRHGRERPHSRVARELREFAGLEKNAILIGQGNKFELWDEEPGTKNEMRGSARTTTANLPAHLESITF